MNDKVTHARLEATPLAGIDEVKPGDDLAGLIASAVKLAQLKVSPSDVLVIAHKVVSKAEGQLRDLTDVNPSAHAHKLATKLDKDPQLVQLVLDQSSELVRAERGVLIARTHHGFVCANAGIDSSNVAGDNVVCLLPQDPDRSARQLRHSLGRRLKVTPPPAIIITDSFGRPWRLGQSDIALGCAGVRPLEDWRGTDDAHGYRLSASLRATADEIAAAADLVRSKHSQEPVVLVRGLAQHVSDLDGPGVASTLRPASEDLFS